MNGEEVSPLANQSMMRLHRLYYVLALFNVITLAGSLYLGHAMIAIVKRRYLLRHLRAR